MAFIGLWVTLLVVSIPYGIIIYTGRFSWLLVFFIRCLPSNLGARAENFLHWELHLAFLRQLRLETPKAIKILGLVMMEIAHFVWGPLFGYIPHTYAPVHIYIHHEENNDIFDTQSTLQYDRTSFFDFGACSLKRLLDNILCIDPIKYYAARGKWRPLLILTSAQLISSVYYAFLVKLNPYATFVFIGIPLIMKGYSSARGIWNWHAFVDPKNPQNSVTNSIVQLLPGLGGPFYGVFHAEHHRQGSMHWTKLPYSFAQHLDEYVRDQGLVFKYDERMFLLLMKQDFDTIAREIFVDLNCKPKNLKDIAIMLEYRSRPTSAIGLAKSGLERVIIDFIEKFLGNLFETGLKFEASHLVSRLRSLGNHPVIKFASIAEKVGSKAIIIETENSSVTSMGDLLLNVHRVRSWICAQDEVFLKSSHVSDAESSDTPLLGICLPTGSASIAAILGIWAAGAAFVPIDPELPYLRKSQLLDDSGVRMTIVDVADRIPPSYTGRTILIAEVLSLGAVIVEKLSPCDLAKMFPKLSNLAYVMYTSGSTGIPKGVLGTHAGLANRLSWMWKEFPFTFDEVCLQWKMHSTVGSIWEIFGPCLAGIPIVIVALSFKIRLISQTSLYPTRSPDL